MIAGIENAALDFNIYQLEFFAKTVNAQNG